MYIKSIIDYSEGNLTKKMQEKFEQQLIQNKKLNEDFVLFNQINMQMRARLDMDEVMNDPALTEINMEAKEAIADYQRDKDKYKTQKSFVNENLNSTRSNEELENEIEEIEREIKEFKVNEISEGWVKEWLEKSPDKQTELNRSYINTALLLNEIKPELKIIHNNKQSRNSFSRIQIISMAAAALIAGMVIIKLLIPSGNPEKIYTAYYEPMTALSPVTRDQGSNFSGQYLEALALYKMANYQTAYIGFSDVLKKDSNFTPALFFAGITQMELGNFEQAIPLLSDVIVNSNEFNKEAQWYLGLAYLKTGDKVKAGSYFESLSASDGFYHDRAAKILRRLR